MSNVIPFKFKDAQVRVVTDESGETWFVGRDVCERLGYADQTSAMKQHCRGVVKYHPIQDGLGRVQETRVLSEPDMLRLIISSTLPAAQEFERWVFEDVLPAIRRTGGYQAAVNETPIPLERRLPVAADNFDAARRTSESLGLSGNQATLSANRMVKATIGVDVMELAGVQRLTNDAQELNYLPSELGKKFSITANQMNKLLAECGLQRHAEYAKGKKRWELLPEGKPFAVITDTAKQHSDGKPVQQILWKESVLEELTQLAHRLRAELPKRVCGAV